MNAHFTSTTPRVSWWLHKTFGRVLNCISYGVSVETDKLSHYVDKLYLNLSLFDRIFALWMISSTGQRTTNSHKLSPNYIWQVTFVHTFLNQWHIKADLAVSDHAWFILLIRSIAFRCYLLPSFFQQFSDFYDEYKNFEFWHVNFNLVLTSQRNINVSREITVSDI